MEKNLEEKEKFVGKKRSPPEDKTNNNPEDNLPRKKTKKEKRREKMARRKERKEKEKLDPVLMAKKNELAWKHINQELKNEKFEFYYKTQLHEFFPTDEKFDELLSKLKEKLPCVFRISKAHPFHLGYKKMLFDEKYISSLLGESKNIIKYDVKNLTSFKEWKDLVYNININKVELKKNELLKNFHKFIQYGVDGGVISRQEAVSMIPPMLMQTKPTDKIFDMCAAPGSKTAQFLETIYENYDFLDKKQYLKDTGFVLANDNNPQRAYMMVHQLKRLNTAGMVVICHDAQFFPTIYKSNNVKDKLLFDKILADVPCSSDAVMRKLPNKWKCWNTKDSFNLHKLQIQILRRGINLLKVGGVISYSTCSLNPIEDEAVVGEIMRSYNKNGELEIIKMTHAFDGTEIVPHHGLNDWKVMYEDKNDKMKLNILKDINDPIYLENKSLISSTCFPQEDLKNYQMENCNRFFPNDSDTSGFFITLIKKVKPFKQDLINSNKEKEENIPKPNIPCPEKKEDSCFGFVNEKFSDKVAWLKDYYGIEDEFPFDQLVSFSNIAKKINFASKGVVELLKSDKENKLMVENAGVKLFKANKQKDENCDYFCKYRVCQDGLMYLLPFMHKRIFFIDEKFLKDVLSKNEIKHDDICDEELKNDMKKLTPGCFVLVNAKRKPSKDELKWDNEKERENYNQYLRNNFIDAICCHNATTRITTMINKEHQHIFELKHGINEIVKKDKDDNKSQNNEEKEQSDS